MGDAVGVQRRTYEATHPWISFKPDLRAVGRKVWMLLGEAECACQHVAGVPLRPEAAGELYKVYLVKGVHATTSIEGNTLSEDEVRRSVEGTLDLPKSRRYLEDEVQNVADACNGILDDVVDGRRLELTPERIRQFNALVLRGLEVDDDTVAGEYRQHAVGVARYRGAPSEDVPYLVDGLCTWLNGPAFDMPDDRFASAVLKAILAHLYIAWIHPFGDGNGRTARLVEYQLLMQSGVVPAPAAHLLSNHYNLTRGNYYRELDRSSKSGGDVVPFIGYAVQGFVDGLREQLDYIREQQLEVTWENHVHSRFRGRDTVTSSRQKHLVLDMPVEPVPRNELRRISVRVAEAYAGKTDKTVTRDLNALKTMELIREVGPRRYQANRALVRAFLPPQARTAD